ncbi:hypothetical protein CDIK_1173 [Cucumispora dikerogammari]|nr:hypothetical protein CDIK_1173 [Cucumispora dikerogammari]
MFNSVIQIVNYLSSDPDKKNNKLKKQDKETTLSSSLSHQLKSTSLEKQENFCIKTLQESFNNLKKAIGKIQQEHIKFMEDLPSNVEKLINQKTFFSEKKLLNYASSDPSSIAYKRFKCEARMLFFKDLFFICHKFFTKIRYMISEATAVGKPLNCVSMNSLFKKIANVHKTKKLEWLDDVKMNINQLSEVKKQFQPRLFDCVMILEKKLFDMRNVKPGTLRTCLFKNGRFKFNMFDWRYYARIYYTIPYFLESYKEKKPSKHFENIIKKTNKPLNYVSSIDENKKKFIDTYKLVESKYKKYLIITKKNLLEICSIWPADPIFLDCKSYIKTLETCCLLENVNLVTIYCKKVSHRDMIKHIRDIYCKGMAFDFYNEHSFFYERIQELVCKRFNHFVYNDPQEYPLVCQGF